MKQALRVLAFGFAAAVALSSCAPPPVGPEPTTPSEPATAVPTQESTSGATVSALDPELIPGLDRQSLTSQAPAFYGAWLVVPQAPALTTAGETLVQERSEAWIDEQGESTGEGVATPELNIQPELTAVGAAIGVRFVTTEFAGASTMVGFTTLWYDGSSDSVSGTDGLLTEGGASEFVTATLAALRDDSRTDDDFIAELETMPIDEVLGGAMDSTNFNPDGSLTVEFDDYSVAAGSEGTIEVTLTASEVESWLSELGRAAQTAASNPDPEQLPPMPDPSASSSAPEPSAQPSTGVDCTQVKCVALTFDDGPGAYTDQVLDMLRDAGARATFFVLGPNVEAHPEMIQRMVAEGHEVGNHTWTHQQLTVLSDEEIVNEVTRTADAVEAAAGIRPAVIRPPYGAVDSEVERVLAGENGAPIILWNVDTLDWKTHDPAQTVAHVKNDTQPGSIILMHDIHETTVEAVPASIEALQEAGYHLVTVDELLASEDPQAGQVHTHGPGGS